MSLGYDSNNPTREQVDAMTGPVVVAFGTNWCGYCMAARRYISPVLAQAEGVKYLLVEDGKGYPLGRSFKVKLWPTLIFLKDGVEVDRVVRPKSEAEVREALAKIA